MEGDPVKLLLVDDERAFVDVLYNRFKRKGLAVSKAYSGTEAIRSLREQDFDVSVLDLKMEDMDGIEVLKVFKRMDPSLQVVMLTGHGSERAAREGISQGAYDYLIKPVGLKRLVEVISAALDSVSR